MEAIITIERQLNETGLPLFFPAFLPFENVQALNILSKQLKKKLI